MKKKIAMLLAAALCMGTFAGCGNRDVYKRQRGGYHDKKKTLDEKDVGGCGMCRASDDEPGVY